MPGATAEEQPRDFGSTRAEVFPAMMWGVTLPWTLLISAAIGIGIMAVPALLQMQGSAADSNHVVGALVVTFAVIAMAEVARPLRFLNLLFGGWLVLAPWLLDGFTTTGKWSGLIAGVVLVLLSLPRGRVHQRYGGWDAVVV